MFSARLVRSWIGAALLVSGASFTSVVARDLTKLTGILARVFLAEDFAAVCVQRDRGFLEETGGPLGTIHAYSLHMKNEVIAPLRSSEAVQILKAAAGSSRNVALLTLRQLNHEKGVVDETRLDV